VAEPSWPWCSATLDELIGYVLPAGRVRIGPRMCPIVTRAHAARVRFPRRTLMHNGLFLPIDERPTVAFGLLG
jgi:hypothetical protein